jgi:hypothetical protein
MKRLLWILGIGTVPRDLVVTVLSEHFVLRRCSHVQTIYDDLLGGRSGVVVVDAMSPRRQLSSTEATCLNELASVAPVLILIDDTLLAYTAIRDLWKCNTVYQPPDDLGRVAKAIQELARDLAARDLPHLATALN